MNEASLAQIRAARPDMSTWLSANAGSGKTRVLTDRVARLLLEGVAPERILCLTYTKAAAMEMQNRLFQRLGQWAMLEDAPLRAALEAVGVTGLSGEVLRRARTLFARAIEAPGGLKIQTIHSFCSSVLRRFPLEAGVSPGFTEIDDRVQHRLIADLLDEMAAGDGRTGIAALAAHLSDDDGLAKLAARIVGEAEGFDTLWDWPRICDWAGISPTLTEAEVLAQVVLGGEAELATRALPHLDPQGRNTAKPHLALARVNWAAPGFDDLLLLEDAFLTGAAAKAPFTAKIDAIGNKAVRDAIGPDMAALNDLMQRVEKARPLRLALLTARRTEALYRFAAGFLPAYEAAKAARGWLDFDDLIRGMRRLLHTRGVAQWVLFRLDGGIDHILVDEAQDTSPTQWEIVKQLAEDFASGEGARADVRRTIFVVGDKKQSIYSFQGADPEGFDRMRAHFNERLQQVQLPFQSEELVYSFRTAPCILRLVDAVAAGAGAAGVGPDVEHKAFFDTKPGRVDLWPLVEPVEGAVKPEDVAWDDPQDIVSADHHSNVLANALADRIQAMIADGEPVVVDGTRRPVEAGDILILVQRRSPLFRKIISALKARNLPMAGVDRAELVEPLAVKDLIALMRFLATPEDDLSLAAILRSPICGWSEDDLFRLARPRKTFLWRALQERAAEWPDTVTMLRDLRDHADFLRPYDLLERALIRHDARRRLIARLGAEAEDGIDAMLSQALAYERMEVPSLTGFTGWLDGGQVTVKRDLAQPNGQIRVMTVHGAKGLEAPVVILPDCGPPLGGGARTELVQPEGGPMVWVKSSDATDEVQAARDAASAKQAEERNRLLYVAMTRAESWLIVAAAGRMGRSAERAWYLGIREGMENLGAQPYAPPELDGDGLRIEEGDWGLLPPADPDTGHGAQPDLPAWAIKPAPPSRRAVKMRSPSDLGGAKVLEGETSGVTEADAMRRGRLVHLLLEHLPGLKETNWPAAAPGILSLEPGDVSETEQADMLAEATRVLTHPDLAHVFAQDTLAEVTVTGESLALGQPVMGVIDRLIVREDRVLVVDFKTNAAVPSRPEDVPEGLLRQMGAYGELLATLYPGREIALAILWSRTAELMELPHDLVSGALQRARGA